MTLNLQHYFTSPVEAVKVTADNMEEVAAWCGGRVATEHNKNTGKDDPYVWVPTPEGSKISWAFKNMWITRRCVISMKGEIKFTYSVFRVDYFRKNYFESPQAAVDATWEKEARQRQNKNRKGKRKSQGNQATQPIDQFMPEKDEVEKVIEGVQETILRMADMLNIPREAIMSDAHETQLDHVKDSRVKTIVENTKEELEGKSVRVFEDPELMETYVHKHPVTDGCDLHDCPIERYSAPLSKQVFSDKTFYIGFDGTREVAPEYDRIMQVVALMDVASPHPDLSELEGKSEAFVEAALNGMPDELTPLDATPSHLKEEPIVTDEDQIVVSDEPWIHFHDFDVPCDVDRNHIAGCVVNSPTVPGVHVYTNKTVSVSKYGGSVQIDEPTFETLAEDLPPRLQTLAQRGEA